jgi:hypothetical protein
MLLSLTSTGIREVSGEKVEPRHCLSLQVRSELCIPPLDVVENRLHDLGEKGLHPIMVALA